MTVSPPRHRGENEPEIGPGIENLSLVTIPLQFKFHLGNVVYLNGGLLVNVLARTSSEIGIANASKHTHNAGMLLGLGLGIGFEHEFSSGILLYLNPNVRWSGFGSIGPAGDLHFLQGGACIGVAYKF